MNTEAEILEDICIVSHWIDVPKETEVFRAFLGKTSARITAREQTALVKSYTKLLQLVNDSATKYCTAIMIVKIYFYKLMERIKLHQQMLL